MSPALSAAIDAARALAWQPHHNLSPIRLQVRHQAHERLVEVLVDGLGAWIPGHAAPTGTVGGWRTSSIGARCAVVDPRFVERDPLVGGGKRPSIEAHAGGRLSPELRCLLEAVLRVARCSFSNRMGEPYYQRKRSMAELRGCLDAWDRFAEQGLHAASEPAEAVA